MQKAPFADCANCPLRDQPCVPTQVPSAPVLVVVGEAPGATEVAQGAPFVGQSGHLLDRALIQVGVDPMRIARTNAVLCRPTGNATPPQKAVQACQERLRHELASIPDIDIVALGSTAVVALDGLADHSTTATITMRRGQWNAFGTRRYLATLHPAYILRQPNELPKLLADLKKLTKIENTFNTDAIQYVVVDHANFKRALMFLQRIKNDAIVAIDTETDFLQWYDTPNQPAAEFLCLIIAPNTRQALVIPRDFLGLTEMFQAIEGLFVRCQIITHNGKFDQHVLERQLLSFRSTHDTMLMSYALNETKGGHGLKELGTARLNVPDYETRLIDAHFSKQARDKRRYSTIPKSQLYEYAAIDTCLTLALFDELKKDLLKERLFNWPYQNVLMPVANALQRVEANGIKIDRPYLEELRAILDIKIVNTTAEIKELIEPIVHAFINAGSIHVPQADWIKSREQYARVLQKCRDEFNPSSWQQVQIVLYDVLKLRHTVQLGFGTNPRSTKEEALLSLQPNDTSGFINLLFKLRRYEKIQGTYVEKLLALADVHDRVHINYLVHGTETGRLSATDALHGIPRPRDVWGRAIRGAFIASPGSKLIVADYAQAELRVFAALSREPTLLTAFNEGRDPHDEVAKLIASAVEHYFKWNYNDPNIPDGIKKEIRTLAKNVNFGELNLGEASGIASMLGGKIPVDVLKRVLDAKRIAQPTATAWKEQQFRFARTHGYIQTRFGRKRRFPLITNENLEDVRKASVNAPVQSEAADLTLLSIVALIDQQIAVCGTWHDSIIAEVPETTAEMHATTMRTIMVQTGEFYIPEVPWEVDVEIVDRWCIPPTIDELREA